MAYGGFLFRFGNYTFPNEFIKWDSYDQNPDQRQDINDYTDANGFTHREALEHGKTQVQFATVKLKEKDVDNIMSNLTKNYINYRERDAYCTYYDIETRTYRTVHMYLDPSLKFRIRGEQGGKLVFGETTFLFIEY